ncbi:MAG: A24 family peptidase [Candidatus Omnitrophica bacterium]|nr:A24 family peptidase [Candidatus Omnitrophota bacterium]
MKALETGLIPDEFTFFGIAAGLFLSVAHPEMLGGTDWTGGVKQAALGLVTGGGILWLTGILGKFLFRKDSMGGGDVKLLAMLGVFLGITKVILVYFLAPVLALPVALYLKWTHKSEIVLYGPYLAAAGVCLFLWGDWIVWFIYH